MAFHIDESWVLIAAAGSGTRMRAAVSKQYLPLAGKPVLEHTLERCLGWSANQRVMLVTRQDDPQLLQVPTARDPRVTLVEGGPSRSESVSNGLAAIVARERQGALQLPVLVHDAARPLVKRSDVLRLFQQTAEARGSGLASGGILAAPATDTIKLATAEGSTDNVLNPRETRAAGILIDRTLPRAVLWRALTPQLFVLGELQQALASVLTGPGAKARPQQDTVMDSDRRLSVAVNDAVTTSVVTDEASAMELAGHQVLMVEGASDNMKITHPQDLEIAELLLKKQQREAPN